LLRLGGPAAAGSELEGQRALQRVLPRRQRRRPRRVAPDRLDRSRLGADPARARRRDPDARRAHVGQDGRVAVTIRLGPEVCGAVDGPANRMLGLAAVDPVLVAGDATFRLAADEWGGGTVDPRGHELLVSFDLD